LTTIKALALATIYFVRQGLSGGGCGAGIGPLGARGGRLREATLLRSEPDHIGRSGLAAQEGR